MKNNIKKEMYTVISKRENLKAHEVSYVKMHQSKIKDLFKTCAILTLLCSYC